jgi:hypothetical protein
MTARRLGFALVALLFVATPALAQSAPVLNPTTIIFTASTDHATTLSGTPVVTRYTLDVYDGTVLVRSTDLGKPTPNASNDITVPLAQGTLSKNQIYTAYVVVIGPGGSARSATASAPFAWPGTPAPASNVRVQ